MKTDQQIFLLLEAELEQLENTRQRHHKKSNRFPLYMIGFIFSFVALLLGPILMGIHFAIVGVVAIAYLGVGIMYIRNVYESNEKEFSDFTDVKFIVFVPVFTALRWQTLKRLKTFGLEDAVVRSTQTEVELCMMYNSSAQDSMKAMIRPSSALDVVGDEGLDRQHQAVQEEADDPDGEDRDHDLGERRGAAVLELVPDELPEAGVLRQHLGGGQHHPAHAE